jgi:hypothetical protein
LINQICRYSNFEYKLLRKHVQTAGDVDSRSAVQRTGTQTEASYRQQELHGVHCSSWVKQALDDHNVTDFAGWHVTDEADAIQGISYEMFVMPLVKAVQELSAENTALKARLDAAGI